MTPERWQQIERLFDEALNLDASARDRFLDTACNNDPDLRHEVEALLKADAEAPAFLNQDAAAFAAPAMEIPPSPAVAGRHIGPYRLIRELGRGGMGVVYLAERDDVDKQVALKLVRGGHADPVTTRRFLLERKVLARLEHPHIARLYDAGIAEPSFGLSNEGTPYFAMEYVEGQPIDVYCDAKKLSIPDRLRLFETVCSAVQHAHQHFVVHRDLKPSNILVTEEGQVKLLDFGIAKVLAEAEEEMEEALTRTGRQLLTPAYAAPEQVEGTAITATTDVYSLGVILYELLTGCRPYDINGSDGRAGDAFLKHTPQRPSTVITQERGDTAAKIARARATTTERLSRRLQGDLDVICLKALHKEPDRRYASAEAFVEDMKRHLAGLPVLARPDTIVYRSKKFIRRHRVGVSVAGSFLVLLGLVIGFYTIQLRQQRDQAQQEAERANQVTQFLINVFGEADPLNAKGDTLNAYQILERGVTRLETEMVNQPLQQATLQDAISQVYRDLGEYEQAQQLAETALATRRQQYGATHPEVAASLSTLASLFRRGGSYAAADSCYREALTIIEGAYGIAHPQWVQYTNGLAQVLVDKGEYEDAEALFREALAIGQKIHTSPHEEIAFSLGYLARALNNQGQKEEAIPLTQDALRMVQTLYGEVNPKAAAYTSFLGSIYFNMGQDTVAERYHRKALDLYLEVVGDEHPDVAASYTNIASTLRNQGRAEEAIPLYEKALAIMKAVYGDMNPSVAAVLYNMGSAYRDLHRYAEAERVLLEMLAIDRATLGEDHPLVGVDLNQLAVLYRDQGAYDNALALHQEALTLLQNKLAAGHRHIGHTQTGYGITLLLQGHASKAEPMLRKGVAILDEAYSGNHWTVGDAKAWLGACLTQLGHFEDAEPLLVGGYQQVKEDRGPQDRYTQQILTHLTHLYDAWDQPARAAEYRALLDENQE